MTLIYDIQHKVKTSIEILHGCYAICCMKYDTGAFHIAG